MNAHVVPFSLHAFLNSLFFPGCVIRIIVDYSW